MLPKPILNVRRTEAEISKRDSSHMPARPPALTGRQVQVLRCVEHFVAVHGFPPSLRDLALMLDMSSLHAITEHLKALERKGFVEREAGERRALRVVIGSDAALIVEPRPLRKAHVCADCKRRRTA